MCLRIKENDHSFIDHVIGQQWEGNDIWLYAPFYTNPEKQYITEEMIQDAKRRKRYYIFSSSMPFIDDTGKICVYAEYGGYKYLYKIPVKEAIEGLPSFDEYLLEYWRRDGVGTYCPKFFCFIINEIYNTKFYEVNSFLWMKFFFIFFFLFFLDVNRITLIM